MSTVVKISDVISRLHFVWLEITSLKIFMIKKGCNMCYFAVGIHYEKNAIEMNICQ